MSTLKRLRSDERGVTAVMFALAVIPMMMAVGAAVDYTRAAQTQGVLQNRIDSVVLASVGKAGDKELEAQNILASYAAPPATTIDSATFTLNGDQLTGTLTASVKTNVMSIVNISAVPVTVTSTAKLDTKTTTTTTTKTETVTEAKTVPGSPVCILVKNPTAERALTINSGVIINAPTCELHIRSVPTNGGSPATMDNAGGVKMKQLCFEAKTVRTNSTPANTQTNCSAIDDPFAGKLPTVTVANNNCSSSNGHTYEASSGRNVTLTSGNYCNINFNSGIDTITLSGNYKGLNISGNNTKTTVLNLNPGVYESVNFNSGIKTVNFAPGLYIWKSATNLNSGINLVGTGVTFYYPDAQSYIQINSGVGTNLKAPTSGTYSGILFFEPLDLAGSSFAINGDVNQHLEGLIYWPSRSVTFNSKSNVTANQISVVVDKLTLNSGVEWRIEPSTLPMTTPATTTTVETTKEVPVTTTMTSNSVRLTK
jgi:Flp pilus assembly protein TadG